MSYLSLRPSFRLFNRPALDILASLFNVAKATAARRPPSRSRPSIHLSICQSLEFVLQVNLALKDWRWTSAASFALALSLLYYQMQNTWTTKRERWKFSERTFCPIQGWQGDSLDWEEVKHILSRIKVASVAPWGQAGGPKIILKPESGCDSHPVCANTAVKRWRLLSVCERLFAARKRKEESSNAWAWPAGL